MLLDTVDKGESDQTDHPGWLESAINTEKWINLETLYILCI